MRRPLIYLLIAFIAGIIAGRYFSLPYYFLLITIILTFLLIITIINYGPKTTNHSLEKDSAALRLSCAWFYFRNWSFTNKWLITGLFLILFLIFLLGFFNIQKQRYFFEQNQHIGQYTDKGKLAMEGIVIEAPLAYLDKNVLIVRCLRIIRDKNYISVSGNIRLVIPPNLEFQYGDFIRFHSTLKKIHSFNNPGGFDYERYLNLQGIHATGFISDASKIILLRQRTADCTRHYLESFRNYLKQIIYNNSSSPQREIIEAMTIGNQNEIPTDVRDNFNKTGAAHILSISGLHIGMVSAVAFFFAFLILKSSEYLMLRFNIIKLAATAAFIMVLIYAFIAGMGVTVMRSALMALIFLIALISGKQKDLYSTLALAGLIILAISPQALFDISFQLSFMAVLSLIYIVPKFSGIISGNISTLPLWTQGIIHYAYLSVIVCIAATIGTLPLIMYYFNRVSCVTIIANLIAVPLLGTLTLAISMLFILSAFFSSTIAGYFIKLASLFVQISVDMINQLASFPWSSLSTIRPNLIEIAVFYLLIFLLIQFIEAKRRTIPIESLSGRLRIIKYLLVVTVLLFAADIIYFTVRDKLSSDLKITVIDVGQGNSILVQFPGGDNMLIDGGGFSESTFDIGKAVVAPFLYHERIGHIDTAVLSHPHPDHLLGLIYIMNNFDVRQIWKSKLPVDPEDFPEWEKTIKSNNQSVCLHSNKSPEKIFNGVKFKVLWPPNYSENDINDLSYDDVNDSSLVLKITFGKVSFLIPGDISGDVETQLIEAKTDLRSDVLVVPHHGSNHSSSTEFIKAVSCRYAIVSAGKANVFHHPHPSTMQRYKDAGVNILRTDHNGAIILTTNGNNLKIDTFIKNK
ncbi:MAG: DNA internalization-related competence protein ComEC/Rec2 [Deltaproteobacteria bacterium HGW-Deltaproteobacteria-2]|jgi:competence protein ComEC|nr:MAG: DNA internalization-related competence protein ComEC/Rec2 [Deltaproteobacteria bacterium HGW-Deltaproteobacteria-2]